MSTIICKETDIIFVFINIFLLYQQDLWMKYHVLFCRIENKICLITLFVKYKTIVMHIPDLQIILILLGIWSIYQKPTDKWGSKIFKIGSEITKINQKILRIRQIDLKISKKCASYWNIPTQDKKRGNSP